MRLLYHERGGAAVGRSYWFNSNCTWPFGSIDIYDQKIVVKMLWFATELKKTEITSILQYGLFKTKIKIIHSNTSVRPYVAFFSFHPQRLQQKLTEAGYKVKNTGKLDEWL